MKIPGIYICLVFFVLTIRAQTSGQLSEASLDLKIPFTVTRYSSKQGLPQNQVLSIIPDTNGELIISTANGVVTFDGVEFTPFIKEGAEKLPFFMKLFLHQGTGRVFGEELNGPLYTLFPEHAMIKTSRASCMKNDSLFCIDGSGTIYGAPASSLKFNRIAETHIGHISSLICVGPDFLIGNWEGVYKYVVKDKAIRQLMKGVVMDFKINPYNKSMYVMCAQHIYKIENGEVKSVLALEDLQNGLNCSAIEFISADEFFVATTQGLFSVNAGHSVRYTKESGLPTLYMQSLYFNKAENCLFAGTGDKGLLKLQFKNCYTFSSRQGFGETASLSSIIQSSSGNILVTATDGFIYNVAGDTVYPYCHLKAMCASLSEIDGTLFAGTWGAGVQLIRNKQVVGKLTYPQNLFSGFGRAVFRDSQKNFWVGGNGVSRGMSIQSVKPYMAGPLTGIVTIYELKNKMICIGGKNGVFIFDRDGKVVKHLGNTEGLMGKEVRSFYEDAENKLWIGTYGGGLYCYDKNKLTCINQLKNAMLNEDAFCLGKDNYGCLYSTSNHGLWRIKEKDLDDFYKGRLSYLIPFYYSEENGILNEEFNGGFQNNYLKTKEGDFYFPSLQGLVFVKPEIPHFRRSTVMLEKLLVNDTLCSFENRSFKRSTHSIQVDFGSVSFLNKYNVHYQYKLENEGSGEWSPPQKKTSISFKMLPPGKYALYLRAIDAYNDRNPPETKFEFEIRPYFYETAWFKAGLIFLFIALAIIIGRISIRRSRKKAEEKERIKRELAELELKAVQAQMNPHFIFNSLNSIKYYLFINDTKSADIFIDNFSILLRDFLEYSHKDFITLEKEKEMLSSYLSLESMRMNPPFTYFIELPEELSRTGIPTLLCQPFVENSVKHGITHSLQECHIHITFRSENNKIICEISDNGIGRKRSAEINQRKPYHTSKGISLVNDKISIIKKTYNLQVDVMIRDVYDADDKSTGTVVTISIPLKHD